MTNIIKVSVDHLYGNGSKKRQGAGPVGNACRLFEAVSQLPKQQQHQIVEVVEAFVAQHAREA